MNSKAITFIRNFSYALSSNLISTLISTLVILIVPKLIGVEEYGYWQLYLFYTSYVGFLHFGWNDGIYLRYGGKEYNDLNKNVFFSQFWMLFASQIIIGIGILIFTYTSVQDVNKMFILEMTSLCLLIVNVRYMLLFILQATNRMKEYARITSADRILYCLFIIILISVGLRQYQLMILADILGKIISLAYAAYCCKDIVFRKISTFYLSIGETIGNINVGIKLMFANIASKLVVGVVRIGIERAWDVSTFGKVSLTLSISNLMMTFINAIGMVMFPLLRRTGTEKLPSIYSSMRTLLMASLLGLLVCYYPLKIFLTAWLPQYTESLTYMALIFPMCVYEGKMSLLIITYLKTLRKEKTILLINVISLGLSVIITIFFTILIKNLSLIVVSIVFILAFRCILAEILLTKFLNISFYKDIILEISMTIIFILTGWYLNSIAGVLIYILGYIFYLVIQKKEISFALKNIRILVKK